MVNANQLKKGSTIVLDGELYSVVEKQHVKPGKGGAFVSTKVKKLSDGTIINKTLRAQEKIEIAFIEKKKMQYLYHKSDIYYFMHLDTYEQKPVNEEKVRNIKGFLKSSIELTVYFYQDKIVDFELPIFVELKVIKTQPAVRGNTVQSGNKPAMLETGIEVQVPLFISRGDIVKIDTRTFEYVERM